MQAVVKQNAGDFAWVEVADPVPTAEQILIEVQAFSLNYGEIRYAQPNGKVIGWDAAGVVLQGDNRFPAGTRVVTFGRGGAWAERRAVNRDEVAALPNGVETGAAAALPVAGVTALQALRKGAQQLGGNGLAGKRVLVTGASGGVGRFAVQLAKYMGAEVVALVGRPERGAGLDALGASQILVGAEGIGSPVDVVLDNVGGDLLVEVLQHTREGAPVFGIGGTSGTRGSDIPAIHDRVQNFSMSNGIGDDLAYLVGLVASGDLDVQIGWRGQAAQINEAVQALLNRTVAGKAVLDIAR